MSPHAESSRHPHLLQDITIPHPHLPPLPSPQLLGSITSGAHYAGALQNHHDEGSRAAHRRSRSFSRAADDPNVEATYKEVMDDLQELYGGKPTAEIMKRRWAPDAVVETPLVRCVGRREVAALCYAVPKLSSVSERVSSRIIAAGLSPNRLVYTQTQIYAMRVLGKKEITSMVVVDLDDDMHIVRLVDEWDGQEPSTWSGASWLRRTLAKVLSWTISTPAL